MKKDRSQDHAPDLDNPEAGQATPPESNTPPVPPKQDPPTPQRSTRFDPSRFRLAQDFTNQVGTAEKVTSISVRKPKRQEWLRLFEGDGWPLVTRVLESQDDRETYLVEPALWPALGDELVEKAIHPCITRSGELFLWPIRRADAFGKLDPWNQSAHEAAELGKKHWIRVSSDMARGRYRLLISTVDLSPPDSAVPSFEEIIDLAFRDRVISDLDHPVLKRLRGEL